jgi:hypothetical protein
MEERWSWLHCPSHPECRYNLNLNLINPFTFMLDLESTTSYTFLLAKLPSLTNDNLTFYDKMAISQER